MSQNNSIFFLAEVSDGRVSMDSLRVLGKAREIADSIGARVEAVVSGCSSNDAELLIRHGADIVHRSKDNFGFDYQAFARAIYELISSVKPRAILANASEAGNSALAFLAAFMANTAILECLDLGLDAESEIIATKQVYQGRFLMQITMMKPQVFTLFGRQLSVPFENSSRYGKVVEWNVNTNSRVAVVSESAADENDSRVTILAGSSVNAKTFQMLEELAKVLGAGTYATNTAANAGISNALEPAKEITSEICITVGIGDAREDLLNVNANTIIAIENDQDASATKIARITMIGEPAEIVRHWLEMPEST